MTKKQNRDTCVGTAAHKLPTEVKQEIKLGSSGGLWASHVRSNPFYDSRRVYLQACVSRHCTSPLHITRNAILCGKAQAEGHGANEQGHSLRRMITRISPLDLGPGSVAVGNAARVLPGSIVYFTKRRAIRPFMNSFRAKCLRRNEHEEQSAIRKCLGLPTPSPSSVY